MPRNQIPSQSKFRNNREKLISVAVKRDKRVFNIWYAYSTKIGKDLVLKTDPEYLNFIWLEGDPDVESFEIDTDIFLANQDESNGATIPDSIVTFRNPNLKRQWREVKPVEDAQLSDIRDIRQKRIQERITEELGCDYLRVTPELLKQHWIFICNWRRAVTWLAAAKNIDYSRYVDEAHTQIDTKSRVLLREFISGYSAEEQPLAIAGMFRCAQSGRIKTDLEKYPIGPTTVLERINE